MNYRYKVGDVVRVLVNGYGLPGTHRGRYYVIEAADGSYNKQPGYLLEGFRNSMFGGYCGERSFELAQNMEVIKVGERKFAITEEQKADLLELLETFQEESVFD